MTELIYKIDKFGTKRWYLNGVIHREDGPAVEFADGTKEWWLNGYLHREDGPAIQKADGTKRWYLNGKFIKQEQLANWNNLVELFRIEQIMTS